MPDPSLANARSWPALALIVAGVAGLVLALSLALALRLPAESALKSATGTLTSFIKLDRRLEAWNHYELVVNPPRKKPELLRVPRGEIAEGRLQALVLREVTALFDPSDFVLYGLQAGSEWVLAPEAARRQRELMRWRLTTASAGGGLACLLAGLYVLRGRRRARQR